MPSRSRPTPGHGAPAAAAAAGAGAGSRRRRQVPVPAGPAAQPAPRPAARVRETGTAVLGCFLGGWGFFGFVFLLLHKSQGERLGPALGGGSGWMLFSWEND